MMSLPIYCLPSKRKISLQWLRSCTENEIYLDKGTTRCCSGKFTFTFVKTQKITSVKVDCTAGKTTSRMATFVIDNHFNSIIFNILAILKTEHNQTVWRLVHMQITIWLQLFPNEQSNNVHLKVVDSIVWVSRCFRRSKEVVCGWMTNNVQCLLLCTKIYSGNYQ